jgi:hypothetical protein
MDDLLDLNFTAAAPIKPNGSSTTPFPRPINGVSNGTSRISSPAPFDLLASLKPKTTGTSSPAFGVTPSRNSTPSQPQAGPQTTSRGNGHLGPDAFSDLLSSFGPSSAGGSSINSRPASGMGLATLGSGMSGLTLVERQARLAQEKKDKEDKERQAFNFDSWGDTLGGSSMSKKPEPSKGLPAINPPIAANATPRRNLLQPVPRKPEALQSNKIPPSIPKPALTKDWGFEDLLGSGNSKTSPATNRTSSTNPLKPPKSSGDPWDFEMLANQPVRPPEESRSSVSNGTVNGDHNDDLLGDLGRPVPKARPITRADPAPSPKPSQPRVRTVLIHRSRHCTLNSDVSI